MTVYEKIMEYINSNNINPYRFEMAAGLTRGSLRNWKKSTPSYENIKKAASYMGVSPEYLMDDSESSEPPIPQETADLLKQLDKAPATIKKAAIAAAKAVLQTSDD